MDKVLIANRGEIACRIARTARRLGIATVAVYSDADSNAKHVAACDEALRIGPAPARDSYLNGAAVLEAARKTGARAVHPGYGFLSESADFAEACARAGLVFVGPPAPAIRAMGSKSAAKALMEKAGVPLLPGYHGDEQAAARLKQEASRIGYPLLVKASSGGGGKGMRVVHKAAEFEAALASCKREASSSFVDDAVLLEKYLPRARHIEMQVFADARGNCIHLFERDCSVQRRHQKVLEEAPAPGLSEERRNRMGAAAVAAARAVGYVGAGTVEFLAAPDGEFHFMEMNTRLQVEHAVTEMITGLDLVEWQFRVAAGEPLPLAQSQVGSSGHAIEARIYAEDPERGFLPSTGRLVHLAMPRESVHVRVDSGVGQGDEITPWYDPMIAKLIVHDASRGKAIERMAEALGHLQIVGVASNVDFLARLAATKSFTGADLDTALIEREREALFPLRGAAPREAVLFASLAALLEEENAAKRRGARPDPWNDCNGWRLTGAVGRTLEFRDGEETRSVAVRCTSAGYDLELDGRVTAVRGERISGVGLRGTFDAVIREATVVIVGHERHVFADGSHYALAVDDPLGPAADGGVLNGALLAPMPGRVVALLCPPDTRVEKGTALLVLEAMKMEHTVLAPAAGTLKAHRFAVGDQVALGAQLVEFLAA